jgi:multicomponent Na+:H+ antiporter subunit D
MLEFVPPGILLILAAILIAATRGRAQAAVVLLAPLLTLWAIWQVPDGVVFTVEFLDYQVQPIEGSPLRRLFGTVFALMAFGGGLFAYRTAKWYELAAAYAYAAGAVGVSFAGDLITLFLFWELMAIFSTVVVWCGATETSRAAGIRYLVMHVLSGVLLKVGIEGVMVHTGSIEIQPLPLDNFDTWMIMAGIMINLAAAPFSAWLADAYPESSATGSVFLSAFTTKTAVLALILLFPGATVLKWLGMYMIFYGIIYALLENDARRILAYSIVNQVGFMVCAVGIGTELALNGAAAHAFAHIIYKALLFMSAGVVLYRTGKRRCSDLGGLFRTMPLTTICAIIGALSISSFPLTSGFVTKTLISEAAAQEGLTLIYFLLAAASAGVFLHAGIKYPWFVFFQKDSGLRPKDAPWNMGAAMVLFAFLCILIGVWPQLLWQYLPYPLDYQAYTPYKVLFYLQLLLFSGLAFFVMLPWMKRTETLSLDTDWIWRVFLFRVGHRLVEDLAAMRLALTQRVTTLMDRAQGMVEKYSGENGLLARTWGIGATAVWVVALLALYLLVYLF